jgi:putative SOS response-associated peptidase YedK
VCNLYTMTATVDEIRRVFGNFAGDRANLPPFDEIYPGRPAPVLRREGTGLTLETMTWGFPGPAAAKGRPVTNIRNLDSPFWRSALSNAERRCIVPVTRFCEWTAEPDALTKRKRKVWFGLNPLLEPTAVQEPLFAFAGLWRPGQGGPYVAFLTCEANTVVGAVHPKAMPVMLRAADALGWLSHDRESACALALPFADADMRIIDTA